MLPLPVSLPGGETVDALRLPGGATNIGYIARSLSRIPRWLGHTAEHYSVAQHSIILRQIMRLYGSCRATQRWALLHDASEAYIGDLITPLKNRLPRYQRIETAVQGQIARSYGLKTDTAPASVCWSDHRLAELERWALIIGELPRVEIIDIGIDRFVRMAMRPRSMDDVYVDFLRNYCDLFSD